MRRSITTLLHSLALVAAASTAQAAQVTFAGVNGVNDGSHYVSPFTLTIGGVNYTALCYDLRHTVYIGQTWEANLLAYDDLSQAYYTTLPDYVERYREAGWLYTQDVGSLGADDLIAIQYAAWSLFDSTVPLSSRASYWLGKAAGAKAAGFAGTDFSKLRVVNSLPGAPSVQGFIAGVFPSQVSAPVPEPGSQALIGVGFACLLASARLRRVRT